jgi:hypothetical protein
LRRPAPWFQLNDREPEKGSRGESSFFRLIHFRTNYDSRLDALLP